VENFPVHDSPEYSRPGQLPVRSLMAPDIHGSPAGLCQRMKIAQLPIPIIHHMQCADVDGSLPPVWSAKLGDVLKSRPADMERNDRRHSMRHIGLKGPGSPPALTISCSHASQVAMS
jgi:hypothetical protein